MKTTVIFRKHKDGNVVAIFPYEINSNVGDVVCYEHIGQHGSGDLNYLPANTSPASPSEYIHLKRELRNLYGYDLEVKRRINWHKYRQALQARRAFFNELCNV